MAVNSLEVPLENEDPETGEVWKMKMKEGYQIFFSIEDYYGQYEIDPEILQIFLLFYLDVGDLIDLV